MREGVGWEGTLNQGGSGSFPDTCHVGQEYEKCCTRQDNQQCVATIPSLANFFIFYALITEKN